MLHALLNLKRPLIVLDLETTSLDVKEARIVEIAFQVWEASGMTKEWRSLVNPGVPIPAEATKTHGISNLTIQGCRTCGLISDDVAPDRCRCEVFKPWPPFKQLAPSLVVGFSNCDYAGQNVRYDLRVLDAEMRRTGQAWSYADARIVDAGRLEALGEPRSLSDLYRKHVGHDMEHAHSALADVRATSEVVVEQLKRYAKLSRDLDILHANQWGKNLIDTEGKFKFVDGVPCFTGWGKYANKPMRAADNGYWDFILGADFPSDVKQLARDAKLGKWPEAR